MTEKIERVRLEQLQELSILYQKELNMENSPKHNCLYIAMLQMAIHY